MNIDQQVADAQALIKLNIDELARHHLKRIRQGFTVARIEAERRHWKGAVVMIGWGAGVATTSDLMKSQFAWNQIWRMDMDSMRCATEIRTPGALLYRSDPPYVNVPEILAIWLRSTTLYRVARRIWVGEKAE